MNIEGLDYNTQRQPLLLPEYGREIQKMVDYAITLPDRDERLRCAKTIVKMMETRDPQIRENTGYQQTLWDHLYLMSHKSLDIDWPYDVSGAEHIHAKPQPMGRPANSIRLRHYGRLVEELWEKLKELPDGAGIANPLDAGIGSEQQQENHDADRCGPGRYEFKYPHERGIDEDGDNPLLHLRETVDSKALRIHEPKDQNDDGHEDESDAFLL